MSKIPTDLLDKSIAQIKAYAAGETVTKGGVEIKGKQRKFVETIDMQVTLKMYDPRKDKRFAGSFRLPVVARPNMKVCVLGDQKHCDEAKELGIAYMSVDDLKKLNKNKALIKKLAKKYDAFVASQALIKQIPRLLGPGLNRAGKFPTVVGPADSLEDRVNEVKAQIKFQMKKVICLSVAVAHVGMSNEDIKTNIQLSANFLASLLKKNWQNISVVYVKSTMGPPFQVFF
jgi:large subunit ribosomal protein L10Ae